VYRPRARVIDNLKGIEEDVGASVAEIVDRSEEEVGVFRIAIEEGVVGVGKDLDVELEKTLLVFEVELFEFS